MFFKNKEKIMTALLIIMLHTQPTIPPISIDFNSVKNHATNKPTKIDIYKKVPTTWSKITKNSN